MRCGTKKQIGLNTIFLSNEHTYILKKSIFTLTNFVLILKIDFGGIDIRQYFLLPFMVFSMW